MHKKLLVVVISIAALSLAACGGGYNHRIAPPIQAAESIISKPTFPCAAAEYIFALVGQMNKRCAYGLT